MADVAVAADFPDSSLARMVGRSRERAPLRAAIDRTLSGHGTLVLISGEAGIGKTTLVNWLAGEAAAHGVIVLGGGCYDLIFTAPYGPWFELFEHYRPAPGPPMSPDALSITAGGPEMASQTDWFHAVRAFLASVAADQPLLLVLEDVHWADSASLDLLRYVARQITDMPILLVATYRSDELTRDRPLSMLVPSLVRESHAQRIDLARLSDVDVRALVVATYGLAGENADRLVASLQTRAEGNPFFTMELLRALREHGSLRQENGAWIVGDLSAAPVPMLVQQVIERRLGQLDPVVREQLLVAAIIGHDVPLDVWQATSQASDEQLATTIERAVEMRVLTESAQSECMRFVHALVREALYAGMVMPRRRQWHRRVGEVLAATARPDPDSVAFHFRQAADVRAIEWLLRAGERAHAVYAPQSAIVNLTEAMTAAEALGQPIPISAFRTRGLACETIGDFERARRDFARARELAVAAGDRQAEWQALNDLGASWAAHDYARAGTLLSQALALAHEIGDQVTIGRSLNRIGNWKLNTGRPLDAVTCHREALNLFECLGHRRGIAESLDLLGLAFILAGDLHQAERYARRAVAAFRELGDLPALASSQGMLTGAYSMPLYTTLLPLERDTREGILVGEQAVATAHEVGWKSGEAFALNTLGTCLIWLGEYRRGIALVRSSLDLATEIGHRQWMVMGHYKLANVYDELLEHTSARRHLEQALVMAIETESAFWIAHATGSLAVVLIEHGHLDEAEALLQQIPETSSSAQALSSRTCAHAQVRLALARGRPQHALRIVDRQIRSAPGMEPGKVIPRLGWLRGDILVRLGREQEAERDLQAARHAAERLDMRLLLWRIDLSLGTLLLGQGRDTDALRSFATARAMIDELADSAPDDLGEAFRLRATALFPALPPAQAATRQADGLTPRELEVLRLVAEGLTDPQIAGRLSVSPRTIHAHLRSIYNKLDVPARAAAARVAVERQLI